MLYTDQRFNRRITIMSVKSVNDIGHTYLDNNLHIMYKHHQYSILKKKKKLLRVGVFAVPYFIIFANKIVYYNKYVISKCYVV